MSVDVTVQFAIAQVFFDFVDVVFLGGEVSPVWNGLRFFKDQL